MSTLDVAPWETAQAAAPRRSTVTVLCHANVCRSVLAGHLLSARTSALGWHVITRGTHADGSPMCATVARRIAMTPTGFALIGSFCSRRLTEADAEAPLILTTTAAEKSAVARMAPQSRRRTFTLLEAVALLEADVTTRRHPVPTDVAGLSRRLDHARRSGVVALAAGATSLDLRDGHGGRPRRHRAALDAVADAVDRLATALGV